MDDELFKVMNKDRMERIDKYNNKINEKRLTEMESICFEMRGEKQAIEVSDYILDLFSEALKALREEQNNVKELKNEIEKLKDCKNCIYGDNEDEYLECENCNGDKWKHYLDDVKRGGVMDEQRLAEIEKVAHMYDYVSELVQSLRAERNKANGLKSTLELVVGMCESIGSFSNGVTWQGMDEGDVMAQKVIDDARKLLDVE